MNPFGERSYLLESIALGTKAYRIAAWFQIGDSTLRPWHRDYRNPRLIDTGLLTFPDLVCFQCEMVRKVRVPTLLD